METAELTDVINVTITTEDFATSDYMNTTDCALAKALKRVYPEKEFTVSGFEVEFINESIYKIDKGSLELAIRCGQPNQIPLDVILTIKEILI